MFKLNTQKLLSIFVLTVFLVSANPHHGEHDHHENEQHGHEHDDHDNHDHDNHDHDNHDHDNHDHDNHELDHTQSKPEPQELSMDDKFKLLGIDSSNFTEVKPVIITVEQAIAALEADDHHGDETLDQQSCEKFSHSDYHPKQCRSDNSGKCKDSYGKCEMPDSVHKNLKPKWNKWGKNVCLSGFKNETCLTKEEDKKWFSNCCSTCCEIINHAHDDHHHHHDHHENEQHVHEHDDHDNHDHDNHDLDHTQSKPKPQELSMDDKFKLLGIDSSNFTEVKPVHNITVEQAIAALEADDHHGDETLDQQSCDNFSHSDYHPKQCRSDNSGKCKDSYGTGKCKMSDSVHKNLKNVCLSGFKNETCLTKESDKNWFSNCCATCCEIINHAHDDHHHHH